MQLRRLIRNIAATAVPDPETMRLMEVGEGALQLQ